MGLFKRKSPKISQSLLRTGDIFVEYNVNNGRKNKGEYKFIDIANSLSIVNVGIISAENTFDVNAIYFDKDENWINIAPVEEVLSQYHIFRTNVSATSDPMLPFSKAICFGC